VGCNVERRLNPRDCAQELVDRHDNLFEGIELESRIGAGFDFHTEVLNRLRGMIERLHCRLSHLLFRSHFL